ncbi:MAG: nitrilase-related carbon-nitrogen hydrolase [Promethearchaeota archaeon]
MTALSKKSDLEQINDLFQQAKVEERNYNWDKEIEILKKIEKISLDKKLKKIEAEVYYKLGEIFHIFSNWVKRKEEVIKNYQLSILNFQKAHETFKKLRNEEKVNATLGFINLLKYISEFEKEKEEISLKTANEYFKKAKIINQQNGNLIDSLKMEIFESRALSLYLGEGAFRIDEQIDFKELTSNNNKLITNIWDNIIEFSEFSDIYIYHFFINLMEFAVIYHFYIPIENVIVNQFNKNHLDRIEGFIKKNLNSTKKLSLYCSYAVGAFFNIACGVYLAINQFEQKIFLKKSQNWLKKAEQFFLEIKSIQLLLLFHWGRFNTSILLISLGFFSREFKYILNDYDYFLNYVTSYFPRIVAASNFILVTLNFLNAALENSTPENQRLNFAKTILDSIVKMPNEISTLQNPKYEMFKLSEGFFLSSAYAILGDLIKEKKAKYVEISKRIFDQTLNYDYNKISEAYIYPSLFLFYGARTGIKLAKNSINVSEKVKYYQIAIDFLKETKTHPVGFIDVINFFLIGVAYQKIGNLTNDDKFFKKSYNAYFDTIQLSKNKGFFNLMGTTYVNLAQIEDRLGNFLSATENYNKAINSFDKAILTLTYTKLSKRIEKLRNYINAWSIIEEAKSYHVKEDHYNARINYEKASNILDEIIEYKFESKFYSAWSVLEKAEGLSKKNEHYEAAKSYLEAQQKFEDSIENFNKYIKKRRISKRDKERISKLIKVAKAREIYCNAQYQVETARMESKKGDKLLAAELYEKAAFLFEDLCQKFKIKREQDELKAIFYLCRAWENMERAEMEQNPLLYAAASDLFEKASIIFPNNRMKKLSRGNSLYCSALQYGSKFDKTNNLEEKMDYYKQIKMYLRDSSKNYQLGGFKQDAQWALATSTFFDGIWHLLQSDNEIDLTKKNQYLSLATNYLNNALDIFDKARYEQKKREILNYLEMIKNEQEILTSALNIIEKPAVSASSVGIVAPSCPIEISSPVSLGEMQQYDLQTESELNWRKRIHHIYFYTTKGVCIYDYSFRVESEVSPSLVTGGLTGVDALIQEVTQTESKVKIIEKEDIIILLEHGKYVSAALVTEEDLITLRNKLKQSVLDVENFFQEELEHFKGNITPFRKIRKILQKIFEEQDIHISVESAIREAKKSQAPKIIRRIKVEEPLKKKYKLIYRNLLESYPRIQKGKSRIGIAQIGLSKTGDLLNEFYEEKVAGLFGLREDKVEIVKSKIKEMIQLANKNSVDILCFPELTIDLNYNQILNTILELVKIYNMYIIPGSYHDQQTKRNISIVIGPDGILWEQKKHIPAIIHYKNHKIKENIDTESIPRETTICNTEFGRIAIVICRDFLDMDLRVELKNFEPPVDIIFNPAFTPVTADFKAAHFDARRSIYAYCFFVNIAEFGDSIIYTPEKDRIERRIKPKEEGLIYKDVDIFELRSERKKWEIEQKKERSFIQSTR